MESKIASASWVTAPGQWENGALRWVFYDCNVLGDPAMAVYTDNPISIQASFPANIPSGTSSVAVNVTSEGAAMKDLTCVILENGVLLGKAVTDISGNASLSLDPAIADPALAQLVVSGYNCTPSTNNLIPKSFTWNITSGNWNSSSSWNPARVKPAVNDILVFDGSIQPSASVSLDYISTQRTGRLRFINNVSVSLGSAAVTKSLNIGSAGMAAPAFEIAAGSTLTISAASPVILNILSGYTAGIAGNLNFQQSAHRLTAQDAGAVTFSNGSVFTAGTGFTGNAFCTASLNSVLFENGSSFVQQAGGSPFGATAPGSVVTFQPGSLFKFTASSGAPDLSGRIYGNLEISSTSAGLSAMTGSGNLELHDLTLTNGNCGLNLTGSTHIKGNISLATGSVLNVSPASAATLYLDGSTAQHITGGGSFSCGSNSTVNSANSTGVTLENAGSFNHFTVSSGSFTLASGGSLITNGTVTGTTLVERSIASDNAWHFLSSPVSAQPIQPAFAPAVLNTTFDFYSWDPEQDLSSGQPWINLRNGTGGLNTDFDPVHPAAPQFQAGSGYLAAYSPGYLNPGYSGTTKTFSGSLNTGNLSSHLVNGSNPWNLAGNPYPSSLDFDAFSSVAGSALATPAYWTVLSDGSFASYLAGSGGINGASRYIAPMQGFFLEASQTAILNFSNSMRCHSSQSWLKNGQELPDQLRLSLSNHDHTSSDEVLIHRSALFTGNTGAEKLLGMDAGSVNLFTVKSGRNYGIDRINDSTERIYLGFVPPATGDFTLSAVANSFPPGSSMILEDLKTGKRHELQNNPVYSFLASPGDEVNRFVLHLKSADGLPAETAWKRIQAYMAEKTLYIRQTDLNSGEIGVYNAAGMRVLTGILAPEHQQSLSLQDLETGLYLVRIVSGRKLYHEKVILR